MKDTIVSTLILIINLFLGLLIFDKQRGKILSLALNPFKVVNRKMYHLLITNSFVHASFDHLLFNILTFYFFSFQLERTIGSLYFLLIYSISAIVSSIPTTIRFRNDPFYYSLGASGAISGIVFSYIFFYPTSRLYLFFLPIGIPAPLFAILYLVYCVLAAKYSKGIINHEAHFWGAISGIVLTIILFPEQLEFFRKLVSLFL